MNAWSEVQARIWGCELCRGHDRVACNIRQQTGGPDRPVKLMLLGVAPPYVKGITAKVVANSATNHEEDNLRKLFILETLRLPWNELLDRGLFLLHGVKCAIVPKDRHQNPPDDVIDICAPRHLGDELKLIHPARMVAFGKAPYRALLKVPGIEGPKGLGVSKSVGELVAGTRSGVAIQAGGWSFQLHVSPFPLRGRRPDPVAEGVLREAAELSGILRSAISVPSASRVQPGARQ